MSFVPAHAPAHAPAPGLEPGPEPEPGLMLDAAPVPPVVGGRVAPLRASLASLHETLQRIKRFPHPTRPGFGDRMRRGWMGMYRKDTVQGCCGMVQ